MGQNEFMGMFIAAVAVTVGLYKIAVNGVEKRNEVTNNLRLEQINATHANTLALNNVSNEMRTLRNDHNNLAGRVDTLEDVVFQKDYRQHYVKDRNK